MTSDPVTKPLCVFEKNGVVCGFAAEFISHSLHEGGWCGSMECHEFIPPKESLCAATLGDGTKCNRPLEKHMNPKQFVPDSEPAETKAGHVTCTHGKCSGCGQRCLECEAEPAAPVSPPRTLSENLSSTAEQLCELLRWRKWYREVRALFMNGDPKEFDDLFLRGPNE